MSESTSRKSSKQIIIVVVFKFNPRDKSELQKGNVVRKIINYFISNKCQVIKCIYSR